MPGKAPRLWTPPEPLIWGYAPILHASCEVEIWVEAERALCSKCSESRSQSPGKVRGEEFKANHKTRTQKQPACLRALYKHCLTTDLPSSSRGSSVTNPTWLRDPKAIPQDHTQGNNDMRFEPSESVCPPISHIPQMGNVKAQRGQETLWGCTALWDLDFLGRK